MVEKVVIGYVYGGDHGGWFWLALERSRKLSSLPLPPITCTAPTIMQNIMETS